MITLEDDGRIVGLILPRSGLWRHAKSNPAMLVDGFAERDIVLARETGILSLVFSRLKRRGGGAAIVFRGKYRPKVENIAGVVTKRVIADAVIGSFLLLGFLCDLPVLE